MGARSDIAFTGSFSLSVPHTTTTGRRALEPTNATGSEEGRMSRETRQGDHPPRCGRSEDGLNDPELNAFMPRASRARAFGAQPLPARGQFQPTCCRGDGSPTFGRSWALHAYVMPRVCVVLGGAAR